MLLAPPLIISRLGPRPPRRGDEACQRGASPTVTGLFPPFQCLHPTTLTSSHSRLAHPRIPLPLYPGYPSGCRPRIGTRTGRACWRRHMRLTAGKARGEKKRRTSSCYIRWLYTLSSRSPLMPFALLVASAAGGFRAVARVCAKDSAVKRLKWFLFSQTPRTPHPQIPPQRRRPRRRSPRRWSRPCPATAAATAAGGARPPRRACAGSGAATSPSRRSS